MQLIDNQVFQLFKRFFLCKLIAGLIENMPDDQEEVKEKKLGAVKNLKGV